MQSTPWGIEAIGGLLQHTHKNIRFWAKFKTFCFGRRRTIVSSGPYHPTQGRRRTIVSSGLRSATLKRTTSTVVGGL